MVAGRAMIRDIYPGHQAQRVMSMVTMIFGLAPAVAPIFGGWLEVWFGWRSIFVFLALFAGVLFRRLYYRLAESLPPPKRQPFAVRPLLANYLQTVQQRALRLAVVGDRAQFRGVFSVYRVRAGSDIPTARPQRKPVRVAVRARHFRASSPALIFPDAWPAR